MGSLQLENQSATRPQVTNVIHVMTPAAGMQRALIIAISPSHAAAATMAVLRPENRQPMWPRLLNVMHATPQPVHG
jgi:hypothetical protein